MSAEAISQVSAALRARLEKALAAASDPGHVFVGPLDDPDAQGAALLLFPYRMVPNPNLRNGEHRVAPARPGQPPILHARSLPLDLYYLITLGKRGGSSEEPLLRVLGFAIQALNDEPNLVGTAVAQETVRVSMETLSTEEISRIWALFPAVNYRTSVAYLASPVWIDPAGLPVEAPAVTHDAPSAGQRTA